MSITRRSAVTATACTLLCSAFEPCTGEDQVKNAEPDSFVGIWFAHYGQTFIYLVVGSDRTAVFALLDQGYSFDEREWFPAKNGIIIGGYPMLRLWKTDLPDRAKVCMQPVPPEATNDTFVRFPLNFYMQRQQRKQLSAKLSDLQPPADWLAGEPPAAFDGMLGKPRDITPD